MARFKLIIALLLVSISVRSQILESGTVDKVQIGMSVDDLLYSYEYKGTELVDLQLEAMYSPAIEYRLNNELKFHAEIDCGYIWRIRVYSESYTTNEGIGVNCSFKTLKDTYEITEIASGETNVFAIVDEVCMSFALDLDQNMSIDEIPDSTRVLWILVNKDCE